MWLCTKRSPLKVRGRLCGHNVYCFVGAFVAFAVNLTAAVPRSTIVVCGVAGVLFVLAVLATHESDMRRRVEMRVFVSPVRVYCTFWWVHQLLLPISVAVVVLGLRFNRSGCSCLREGWVRESNSEGDFTEWTDGRTNEWTDIQTKTYFPFQRPRLALHWVVSLADAAWGLL